ncbi:sigma-70 family RNA polymerase sigma factor [Ferrovibrio sp.]|uniref:sigma-70 family RNA polymerase sigma factor n=1 Tax=Ferrovibrio sp. TaxID=1917215 RepID=UPI00311F9701
MRVFLAHRAALVDYAAPLVGGRAQAEDLVQEAYIRFVEQKADADILQQPASYLYRIVRNLAMDGLRRLAAESRRDRARAVIAVPEAAAPSPEDELIHRDELLHVRAALAELAPDIRRAFELHRLEGMTFQQIGAILGVSHATAHRMAREAMTHVMRRLHRRTT